MSRQNADYEWIIERLRKRGRHVCVERVPLIPQEDKYEWRPDELCAEAADAIEALLRIDGSAVTTDGGEPPWGVPTGGIRPEEDR